MDRSDTSLFVAHPAFASQGGWMLSKLRDADDVIMPRAFGMRGQIEAEDIELHAHIYQSGINLGISHTIQGALVLDDRAAQPFRSHCDPDALQLLKVIVDDEPGESFWLLNVLQQLAAERFHAWEAQGIPAARAPLEGGIAWVQGARRCLVVGGALVEALRAAAIGGCVFQPLQLRSLDTPAPS